MWEKGLQSAGGCGNVNLSVDRKSGGRGARAPVSRARLMMIRAGLHTVAVVIALAITLRFAFGRPMDIAMGVYALAWIGCALLYGIALFGWESLADALEARIRRNLHDERLRDEMLGYQRRLRVVRAIHRARAPEKRKPPEP